MTTTRPPDSTWLVECRIRKRGEPWTLTVVPQVTGICPHCRTSIFIAKNPIAEHRA